MRSFHSTITHAQFAADGSLPITTETPLGPVTPNPAIEVWQRHYTTDQLPIICPSIAKTVFDTQVVAALCTTLSQYADIPVALIYAHRGHQLHYRSPALPHLLDKLPQFASVMSLRAQDDALPASAWSLSTSALAKGEACLILNDRTRRLVDPRQTVTDRGAIDYSLFIPSNVAPALPQEHSALQLQEICS